MTVRRTGRALVAALLAVCLFSGVLLAADPATQAASDPELQQALAPLWTVLHYLRDYAHRPVPLQQLVVGAIRGAVAATGDPYAAWLTPAEYESFATQLQGEYTGVGMQVEQCGEYVCVVAPFPGSPAERAGLRPGDRILAVDGQDIRGQAVEAVAARVRGPAGTAVELTIQREGGEPFRVRIVRALIHLETVTANLFGDVGYIRITQFSPGVAERVRLIHDRLVQAGVKGIVLDLRNNPGGLLDEAVGVARVFVPRGPIVHVVSRLEGETTYYALGRPPGPPVAVLVNGGSASASEIVAAAIRQSSAGFLVGQRTYGKGTVQVLADVGEYGVLKLTIAEYLPPDRRSLEGRGLDPDVPVEPLDRARELEAMAPLTGRWPLAPGDQGLEVLGLQQRLRWLGYAGVPEHGRLDAATAKAVRQLQLAAGLLPSGVYDTRTHEALTRAVEKRLAQARQRDVQLERAIQALRAGRR